MGFILCLALLPAIAEGPSADRPQVIRQPLARYLPTKSDSPGDWRNTAVLSPDGALVASVREGELGVYAIGKPKPLFTVEPGSAKHGEVAFSRDGKRLAFGGTGERIAIMASRTGETRTSVKLADQLEEVDRLAFSPDGRLLAVSSGFLDHKNLRVFDATNGKLLGEPLKDVDGGAYQLVFSDDGKRLVANHHFVIYLVDVGSLKLTAIVPAKAAAVFFQDEMLSAVQAETGEIREVAADGFGKKSIGRFAEKLDNVGAMRMVTAGHPVVAALPRGNEVVVRNSDARELFRVKGEDSPIRRLHLSADGRFLAVFRESQAVEVFRLE